MFREAWKFISRRDPRGFYHLCIQNKVKIRQYTYASVIIGFVAGAVSYEFGNIGGMQTAWAASAVVLLIYWWAIAILRSYANLPWHKEGCRLSLNEKLENSGHGGERIEVFLLSPYVLIFISIAVILFSIFR